MSGSALLLGLAIAATGPAALELTWLDPAQPVAGLVTLRVVADGEPTVRYVVLVVDGRPLRIGTALPLDHVWDTTAEADGTHRVRAFVYRDGQALVAEGEWLLTVRNRSSEPLREPPGARRLSGSLEERILATLARVEPVREAFGPHAPPVARRRVQPVAPPRPVAAAMAVSGGPPSASRVSEKAVACGLVVRTPASVVATADGLVCDGWSYAGVRCVFEAAGGEVEWRSGKALIRWRGRRVVLTVGEPSAMVDGRPVALGAPVLCVAGRVVVPLRALERLLPAQVGWDALSRTATVRVRAEGEV